MNLFQKFKSKVRGILNKYFSREKNQKFPIFYINGNQTLPPPLSIMEEEKLLKKLDEKDDEAKKISIYTKFVVVSTILKNNLKSRVECK